ncbi:Down syndrome cell adhesion molecule [Nymphon striatum]|nr:Down syndrome cell adhesion molecule [Nymphon striatum]
MRFLLGKNRTRGPVQIALMAGKNRTRGQFNRSAGSHCPRVRFLLSPEVVINQIASFKLNDRAVLTCVATKGDPPVQKTWMKDNKTISTELGLSITDMMEFSALLIPKLLPVHNGEYKCVGRNVAGQSESTVRIQVQIRAIKTTKLNNRRIALPFQFEPEFIEDENTDRLNDSEEDESEDEENNRAPPEWIRKPSDKVARSGSDIIFHCQARGYPIPRIKWKRIQIGYFGIHKGRGPEAVYIAPPNVNIESDKNSGDEDGSGLEDNLNTRQLQSIDKAVHDSEVDVLLSKSKRMKLMYNSSLLITNVSNEDSGRYKCDIKNGIGVGINQIVTLNIGGIPDLKTQFSKVVTLSGNRVRLMCQVTANRSISMTWTRLSMELDQKRVKQWTKKQPKQVKSFLGINYVIANDAGTYFCHASGQYGKVKKKIELSVIGNEYCFSQKYELAYDFFCHQVK